MTILIAARNAAATIERAILSCAGERAARLVLIDDHSTDDTVARAKSLAGSRLRVVRAGESGGVSQARQAGLDAVETEFGAWLDADDEWVPGRLTRLSAMLRAGHDIAIESIDLFDGPTGQPLRRLTVPAFLRRPKAAIRLFERNFLPGDTQIAFRTSTLRDAGGYDRAICGPESYDLLLRVMRRGASLVFGDEAGYKMHAYPNSVSRDIDRQTAALAMALSKHHYADIRALYRSAGYGPRITAWAMVCLALYRNNPSAALSFLDEASPHTADPNQILEADGPWPFEEGWRRAFQRGTVLLMLGGRDKEALRELEKAESLNPTAEGANNLGVAHARTAMTKEASHQFASALARFPGYHDAEANSKTKTPVRITSHPLRRLPSRNDYAIGAVADRPGGAKKQLQSA